MVRARIGRFFAWVVTGVQAGCYKPAPEFSEFLPGPQCGLTRCELLFVGNHVNVDIAGVQEYGICTVWRIAVQTRLSFPRQERPIRRGRAAHASFLSPGVPAGSLRFYSGHAVGFQTDFITLVQNVFVLQVTSSMKMNN